MPAAADLPERARNRALRRADWRFLLADPAPATAGWLGTNAGLRASAEAAAGRVVDLAHAAGRPVALCDLVVLADPDGSALRAAHARLAPNGTLYAEWNRRAPGPARARQLLTQAGFERVRCYRAWPARERAVAWVPLEAPGALRHLLGLELRPGTGVRHRVAAAVRRALRAVALRAGGAHPLCVVAVRAARAPGAAPAPRGVPNGTDVWAPGPHEPPALRAFRAAPAAEPADQAGPLSWLLLTPGGRSVNKVVGLVFAEPAARPRAAVKAARVPESRPALAREAAVLRALDAGAGDRLPWGVPRVLLALDDAHRLTSGGPPEQVGAVAETALAGTTVLEALRARRHGALAGRATAWLADFAAATRRPALGTVWDRVGCAAFDRFAREFGAVADAGMLHETRDYLATLGSLPAVCEHRDFSPWNILVAGRGLAVLDWESAELDGVPGPDLVYFLAHLGFFRDGARGAAASAKSYQTALRPHTRPGAVRRSCLTRYADRVGFDDALWHPLALLTWVLHAASEYQQFRTDAGGADPTPDQLRASVFLALWGAELRDGGRR